ncbi:hypothetical protein [Sphaerisporangium fuscum]|uniref:hypothetical protein n=1 Tax=Sphaerisporangium fuscum TaxID=2835868 RepID=UPI001BDD3AA4|nr:hypothetical protein [Sphaerisporangium fuscum]
MPNDHGLHPPEPVPGKGDPAPAAHRRRHLPRRGRLALLASPVPVALAVAVMSPAGATPGFPGIPPLPDVQAVYTYKGENPKPATVEDVIDRCSDQSRCTWTEVRNTEYWSRPKGIGEVYINCTRESVKDPRAIPLQTTSIDNAKGRLVYDEKTTGPKNESIKWIEGVLLAKYDEQWIWKNPKPVQIDGKWVEGPYVKKVEATVLPGEASWIEIQYARHRIVFDLKSKPKVWGDYDYEARNVTLDSPSAVNPDRVYQRTGPMTRAERAQCDTPRLGSTVPNARLSEAALLDAGPALVPRPAGTPSP